MSPAETVRLKGVDAAPVRIAPVRTREDLAAAAALFRAYAVSLPIDLAFQSFEAELAAMPGAYAPPAGELLLARSLGAAPVGCVALRPIGLDGWSEMKRLYVMPSARGSGLGGRLVDAIIEEAVRIGYREIRLDTLPTMAGALALYGTRGFERTGAYYDTPVVDTVFMRRTLRPLPACGESGVG